jgi:CheY-like chemotaxis protein
MRDLKRFLLAEDDPRDVELTLRGLSEYGLANEVQVVHNGEAVREYLRREGPYRDRPTAHPAIAILDLKRPRVGGVEALRDITDEALRQIPVVVLTSSRRSEDLHECCGLGVNTFVVKSATASILLEAVKGRGVFRALLNEPRPGSAPKRH